MKVISTTDLSYDNDGHHIYKSVSLIEEFGMYNILTAEKKVIWADTRQMYLRAETTCDLDRARYMYKQSGGILED